MTYTKQTWADGEAGGTPISAARLNYMEDGIEGSGSSIGVTAVAATGYTLQLTDAGKVVEQTASTAATTTVPANATVAFPIGTLIEVTQFGAGQLTITPAVGVTLLSPGGRRATAEQYSTVALRKTATDTWHLIGDLA